MNLILKQFNSSSICLNLRMLLLQSLKWHKILFNQFIDKILSYTSLGQRAQIAQRACPRLIIRYTGKTYDKPKEEAVFRTINTKFFLSALRVGHLTLESWRCFRDSNVPLGTTMNTVKPKTLLLFLSQAIL